MEPGVTLLADELLAGDQLPHPQRPWLQPGPFGPAARLVCGEKGRVTGSWPIDGWPVSSQARPEEFRHGVRGSGLAPAVSSSAAASLLPFRTASSQAVSPSKILWLVPRPFTSTP
ncbi:MAG: hypothetical protein ACXVXF_10935 [Mycobacteriaceae bacterium]